MSFQNQAGIDAEINALLPSNDTGAVTAAALRQVLHDMNAATFQVASSKGLAYSVFQFGAVGDGSTNDAAAFNNAMAANTYVVAPPANYAIKGPAVSIPPGVTLEAYPGAAVSYAGAGTLLISPGGSFITKEDGDQNDGWLWARSISGARSTTQDPLGMLGRTGSFNFAFVTAADDGQTSGIVNNLVSFQQFGGAGVTGAREALLGYAYQTAVTSISNAFRDYVGATLIAETSSGDGGTLGAEQGAYFGGNSQSRLNAGAAHVLNATAHEFDVYNAAGCSLKWNWGINIVSFNAVQGSSNDAAIVIYSGNSTPSNGNTYGPGVGFHNGICFAEIDATGRPPVDSSATLIGTHLETLPGFSAANGIDFRNFTFSNYAFASPGYYVDGSGNVATSIVGGYPGGTYLTLQSPSTVGTKIMLGNTSDPTIYVRADTVWFQDPTGANNLLEITYSPSQILLFAPLVNPAVNGVATVTHSALGGNSPNANGDGLVLQNLTAAAAGTQQDSPNIHLIGQGWKTASGGASQTVDWAITNVPVQGTNNPSTTLNFSAQVNGAGYTILASLSSGGATTLYGTTGAATLIIAPQASGQQAIIDYYQGSSIYWQMGKNFDNSFFYYDAVRGANVIQIPSNGDMTLMPTSGKVITGGSLAVGGTTASSSTSTGALTVAGGIGVAGTSYIAGIIATASGGLQVGSPTGGDLGPGKINVSGGIYLNNTAYTNPDYVFEKHFTGKIEKFADRPRANTYRGLIGIADLEKHVAEHLRLPGISDGPTDIFERGDIALEKLEEQALYIFELNARIGRLERAAAVGHG
jgi:hypothetical protein